MESPETEEQKRTRITAERERQRSRLITRLRDEDADDLADRLAKCGREMRLYCTACGHIHTAKTRCDLKWCPSCQHRLATRTMLRYAGITEAAKWPLLLTLTVENYDEASFDFVRHVRRSFGKLRRLRWWRRCVVGGIASVEVTNKGRGWHPHVHALIDSSWLSVTVPKPAPASTKAQWASAGRRSAKEVGEQWELCTQRPASVHVRRIWGTDGRDSKPACMEVLKYSVKGSELVDCPDKIAPLIRMMDGCRLVTSWGTMYGNESLKKPPKRALECARCHKTPEWIPEDMVDRIAGHGRNYTK